MLTAILLLVSPTPTWKRLASANRAPWAIFLFWLLPLLAITCAFEAWSLAKFGTHDGALQRHQNVSADLAMRYGTSQFFLGILTLFVASFMMHSITTAVHIQHVYSQCFRTIAYAMGPVYLLRFLDAWDLINPWVVCAFSTCVIFSVLYTGVIQVTKPDPAKAFGLYLTSCVILSVTHVASQIFAQLVLKERLFKGGAGWNLLGF